MHPCRRCLSRTPECHASLGCLYQYFKKKSRRRRTQKVECQGCQEGDLAGVLLRGLRTHLLGLGDQPGLGPSFPHLFLFGPLSSSATFTSSLHHQLRDPRKVLCPFWACVLIHKVAEFCSFSSPPPIFLLPSLVVKNKGFGIRLIWV